MSEETANIRSPRKKALMQEIMLCAKANGHPVTGDLYFGLLFSDELSLVKIAQELHIPMGAINASTK